MRIPHLADRLSDRGAAYWHMRGASEALREEGHDAENGRPTGAFAPKRWSAKRGPRASTTRTIVRGIRECVAQPK